MLVFWLNGWHHNPAVWNFFSTYATLQHRPPRPKRQSLLRFWLTPIAIPSEVCFIFLLRYSSTLELLKPVM